MRVKNKRRKRSGVDLETVYGKRSCVIKSMKGVVKKPKYETDKV